MSSRGRSKKGLAGAAGSKCQYDEPFKTIRIAGDGSEGPDFLKRYPPRFESICKPGVVDIAALKGLPLLAVEFMVPCYSELHVSHLSKHEGGLHPNRLPYIGAVILMSPSWIQHYVTMRLHVNSHYGIVVEDLESYLGWAARGNVSVYYVPMELEHMVFSKRAFNEQLRKGCVGFPASENNDPLMEVHNSWGEMTVKSNCERVWEQLEKIPFEQLANYALLGGKKSDRNNFQKSMGAQTQHQPRDKRTKKTAPNISKVAVSEFSETFAIATALLESTKYDLRSDEEMERRRNRFARQIHDKNVIEAMSAIVTNAILSDEKVENWRDATKDHGESQIGCHDKKAARNGWKTGLRDFGTSVRYDLKAQMRSTEPFLVVSGGQIQRDLLKRLGCPGFANMEAIEHTGVKFSGVEPLFCHTDIGNSRQAGTDFCSAGKKIYYLWRWEFDSGEGCWMYKKMGYSNVLYTGYGKEAVSYMMERRLWMDPILDSALEAAGRMHENQRDITKYFDNGIGAVVPLMLDKSSFYSGFLSPVLKYMDVMELSWEQVIEVGMAIPAFTSTTRWREVWDKATELRHVFRRHAGEEIITMCRRKYGSVTGGKYQRFAPSFNTSVELAKLYLATRKMAVLVTETNRCLALRREHGRIGLDGQLRKMFDDMIDDMVELAWHGDDLQAHHIFEFYSGFDVIQEPLLACMARIPEGTLSGQRIISRIEEVVDDRKVAEELFNRHRSSLLQELTARMKETYPHLPVTEKMNENLTCKQSSDKVEVIDPNMRVIYIVPVYNDDEKLVSAHYMSFTNRDRTPRPWLPPALRKHADMASRQRNARRCTWENPVVSMEELEQVSGVLLYSGVDAAEFSQMIEEGGNDGYKTARQCFRNMTPRRRNKLLLELDMSHRRLVRNWRRDREVAEQWDEDEDDDDDDDDDENESNDVAVAGCRRKGAGKSQRKSSYDRYTLENIEAYMLELMGSGRSSTVLPTANVAYARSKHRVHPTPWCATPAFPKPSSKKKLIDPDTVIRRDIVAQIKLLRRQKVPDMPGPVVMLQSVYGAFVALQRELRPVRKRQRRGAYDSNGFIEWTEVDCETSPTRTGGVKVVNIDFLMRFYNPGDRFYTVQTYEAHSCMPQVESAMTTVNRDNVVAWESPPVDYMPDIVAGRQQRMTCARGFYSTICIDGLEYDYSRSKFFDSILPGELVMRSVKGRRLYANAGLAQAAAFLCRMMDQELPDMSALSLLEAKYKRLTQQPRIMKELIDRYGATTPWPNEEEMGEYVFVTLGGVGGSRNERLTDPHIVFARHGGHYYVGGLEGGRGLVLNDDGTISSEQGNLTWKNWSSLEQHCQVWNEEHVSVAHGRKATHRSNKAKHGNRRY